MCTSSGAGPAVPFSTVATAVRARLLTSRAGRGGVVVSSSSMRPKIHLPAGTTTASAAARSRDFSSSAAVLTDKPEHNEQYVYRSALDLRVIVRHTEGSMAASFTPKGGTVVQHPTYEPTSEGEGTFRPHPLPARACQLAAGKRESVALRMFKCCFAFFFLSSLPPLSLLLSHLPSFLLISVVIHSTEQPFNLTAPRAPLEIKGGSIVSLLFKRPHKGTHAHSCSPFHGVVKLYAWY